MSCGQELLEGGKKEAVVEVEGNEIAVQVWGSQCRLAHAFQLRDELVRTERRGCTTFGVNDLIRGGSAAQAEQIAADELSDTEHLQWVTAERLDQAGRGIRGT